MKKIIMSLLFAASAAAQVQSAGETGMLGAAYDYRISRFRFPESTVANLPSAATYNGFSYVALDCLSPSNCTSGGGTSAVLVRSNGVSWQILSSGSGGSGAVNVTSPLAGDGSSGTPLTCTTCTTGSNLTNLSILAGGGSQALQATNLTTDLNTLVAPGLVQFGAADSTHSGYWEFPAGIDQFPGNSNTVGLGGPPSVVGGASYEVKLPSELPIGGVMVAPTTTANQSQTTWSPYKRVVLASPYTNATTGMTDVTGFAFPVLGSATYSGGYNITCKLIFKGSAGTAGMQLAWTGPASPTTVTYSLNETTTSGAASVTHSTATTGSTFATVLGPTTLTSTATDMPAEIVMGLINGTTAGTVQLQAKANGAGTITIEAGSFCVLQ